MKKMRGNCFCVTLLSLALFQGNMFWWGNRAVYRVPNLGDEMPCEPQAQYRLLISSAETAPSCLAWFNGVAFEVAGAQGSKVIYVAIDDPRYRTPEGIHPGSRLNEVLAVAATEPLAEPGWAFHTRLESGWNVAFVNGPTMTHEPLPRDSEVKWLYKR